MSLRPRPKISGLTGVAHLLQRLEKASQIDDALARHQPFAINNLVWRDIGSIGHLNVDDAFPRGGQNVLHRSAGVMPMPGVEQDSNVLPAGVSEFKHFIMTPNEFVRESFSQMHGAYVLKAKTYVRASKYVGNRAETAEIKSALLRFRQFAGRQDPGRHPGAANRRCELCCRGKILHPGLVGLLILAKLHRQSDDRRPEFQASQQHLGFRHALLHRSLGQDIGAGKARG
jgi:hypothetical protein